MSSKLKSVGEAVEEISMGEFSCPICSETSVWMPLVVSILLARTATAGPGFRVRGIAAMMAGATAVFGAAMARAGPGR